MTEQQKFTDRLLYNISDNAHFLAGLAAVLACNLLFGHPWIAAIILMAWATVKEVWLDPVEEDKEVAGSGLRDWLGYAAGVAFGYLLIWISVR